MSYWDGVKWYYRLCGARGVFAVSSFRVFGHPLELSLIPRDLNYPVWLRIDTSDFCAYADVLTFKTKSYDPEIPGFDPKVVVDLGAHIGMASIYFAHRYPKARVIAVEPEPSNFAALVRNTRSYPTIAPIQAAIWKKDGEVTLGRSNAHPKGSFQILPNGDVHVRAMTLHTLMQEIGIRSIDLLKVDIEGAESDVFEACNEIGSMRVIAIELHDRIRPGCGRTVKNAARGFRCKEAGEVTFLLNQYQGANLSLDLVTGV
jgi:FkbM family methyltransferase